MLKQEQIKLETRRKGTLVKYFTTFSGQTEGGGVLSYLIENGPNGTNIVESLLDTQTSRGPDNYFYPTSGYTIYTGSTIIEQVEFLENNTRSSIYNRYVNQILSDFLIATSNTGNTLELKSHVQFIDNELNDMFVNIQLNRSLNNLDTLNIYNKAINEQPDQESTTGVLFGRLTATQNLEDSNGNKIIIPLKNTVVALFNPSDLYPSVTSVDDNGDRISLNIKENIAYNLSNNYSPYFNKQSYLTDYRLLKDTSSMVGMPEMYKYTAITNENGEFILHNVPIGAQTFMCEVDLLKQGLTTDEVALNFFPYPTDENPNIDRVPHYFFRQIPVNIVPAWGTNQTGYTELNVKINLDLRKWCTYTVSPIAYKNKTIEEMQADGISSPLTVGIRDMTKKLEPGVLPKVEVVEIQDVYDRNTDQVNEWANEFKQRKNKVEFRNSDFNYFKLPANLYDPNGVNTQGGVGVWLAAYQFKMYYGNPASAYKATGFSRERINNLAVGINHLDLNRNADLTLQINQTGSIPEGKIGVFPYEKAWDLNYPNPYKIPKIPRVLNTGKTYNNGFADIPEDPLFLDGDYAGRFIANTIKESGYGSQFIGDKYNSNQFAREVTKYGVFKYENGVRWDEQYSNGFFPQINTGSTVINGEKYQRLECGYVYWLKPEGWPRIITYDGHVDLLSQGDQSRINHPDSRNWSPDTYADGIYKFRENILIRMDASGPVWRHGALDIYRIVDPTALSKRLSPPIEKFIKIHVQDLIAEIRRVGDLTSPTWLTVGSSSGSHKQFYRITKAPIRFRNRGTTKVTLNIGNESKELEPLEEYQFEDAIEPYSDFILPSNSNYDIENNCYTKAKYDITFWSILTNSSNTGGPYDVGNEEVAFGGKVKCDLQAGDESNIPDYYVVQVIPTIVNMDGENDPDNSTFYTANSNLPTPFIAINGFAYCLFPGFPWFFANASETVVTYYPGHDVFTPNPYIYLLSNPIETPFVTGNGGNYPFAPFSNPADIQ